MTAATKNTGDILGPLKSVPAETVYTAEQQAARAMLAALHDLMADHVIKPQLIAGGYYGQVNSAIAQAEAAGITTGER